MERSKNRIRISSSDVAEQNQHLPPELLVEILGRLPSKTLLRLRCVSWSWCSLVDDPDFALMHRGLFRSNNGHRHTGDEFLLLLRRSSQITNSSNHQVFQFGFQVRSADTYFRKIWDLTPPGLNNRNATVSFMGFANGLALFLTEREVDNGGELVREVTIKLSNPSIRKFFQVTLPPKFDPQGNDPSPNFDLGHDPANRDYKVLSFMWPRPVYKFLKDLDPPHARLLIDSTTDHLEDDSRVICYFPASIEIYSLKTRLWKNISSSIHADNNAARPWWWHTLYPKYLNGMIYWVGVDKRIMHTKAGLLSSRIVSFDVGSEVFKWNTKLPDQGFNPRRQCILGIMGDSTLSFLARYKAHVTIWLMDHSSMSSTIAVSDDDDQYPWTKLCTLSVQVLDDRIFPGPKFFMTRRGHKFLDFQSGSVTSYDLQHQQNTSHNVYQLDDDEHNFFVIGEYIESLELLTEGTSDNFWT